MPFPLESKMRKLNIFIIVSIVVMTMLIGSVSAMTPHQEENYNKIDFFFSKLKYAFNKGIFLFTSWGQSNSCSINPDDEVWTYGTERIDCTDFCSYDKCAIDSWIEPICLGGTCSQPSSATQNNYVGEENGDGAYFSGDISNAWYFSEVYCCPSDFEEPSDHETDAYECHDGDWDSIGNYALDDYCSEAGSGNNNQCWCSDEGDNFYIDESGGVHCRSSPSSSWCSEEILTTCWQRIGEGCSSYQAEDCTGDFTSQQACEDKIGGETCDSNNGVCRLTFDSNTETDLGKLDCGFLKTCIVDKDDGDDENGVDGDEIPEGEEPTCKEKEEIFYTNPEGRKRLSSIFFTLEKEVTPQIIDTYIPAFSGRYFELKEDACCEDFEYTYVDTIDKEITPFSILLGLLGKGTVDFTYDVYKCIPEGEGGFCLEFAQRWLNPITKTDDCQTNSFILIFLIVGGFIAVSRLIG